MLTTPDHNTSSQTGLVARKPAVQNLADVAALIERDQHLEPARRAAYCGAIRTISSILNQPSMSVPASMAEIDARLRQVPQATHGRARKTLANTRSRLKSALLHVSVASKLPPRGTPLAPAWAALHQRLVDPRLRNGLSRLIRVGSHRGIEPGAVDDALVDELVRDVSAVNWGRDALPFWRKTVALWNEAAASVEGWPQNWLTPPPEPERVQHLPLDAFPESFVRDVEAYLQREAGSDLFADNAPTKPLKPSTLGLRRNQLRIAASTLASKLGGPEHVTTLATLLNADNAKQIFTALLERAEHRHATAFIRGVATTLLTVGRRHGTASLEDLKVLAEIKRRLGSNSPGLTEKNRRLVRQLDDPKLRDALLGLPDVILAQLSTRRLSPERRLQQIRTALAIALLLRIPLRMQNLSALRLDHELQWPTGRAGQVFITLLDADTKNTQPLEYEIAGRTRDLLHDYLDRYRVHFANGVNPWLFVHTDGRPVSASTLRDGIIKAIKRQLGIHMTPHQFRHVAAAIALDARPGAIALVQGLLGHKNIKTTLNFYAGMRTREAGREYDLILAKSRLAGTPG